MKKRLLEKALSAMLAISMLFSAASGSVYAGEAGNAVRGGEGDNAGASASILLASPSDISRVSDASDTANPAEGSSGVQGGTSAASAEQKAASSGTKADAGFSYEKEVAGYKITLSAEKGILPEDTEVSIREVSQIDGRDLEKMVEDTLPGKMKVQEMASFDITLLSGGKEIQPEDGAVQISIVLSDEMRKSSAGTDTSFKVLHIKDADDVEEVSFRESGNGKSITYEAESFSIYTVLSVANNQKIVYASTAEELQKAIGSDTKIILEGKEYKFQRDLRIADIENLTILGSEETELLFSSYGAIYIGGSNHIIVENLGIRTEHPEQGSAISIMPHYQGTEKNYKIELNDLDIADAYTAISISSDSFSETYYNAEKHIEVELNHLLISNVSAAINVSTNKSTVDLSIKDSEINSTSSTPIEISAYNTELKAYNASIRNCSGRIFGIGYGSYVESANLSSAEFQSCDFSGNYPNGQYSYAIEDDFGCSIKIQDSTFSDNKHPFFYGYIAAFGKEDGYFHKDLDSESIVENCRFSNNTWDEHIEKSKTDIKADYQKNSDTYINIGEKIGVEYTIDTADTDNYIVSYRNIDGMVKVYEYDTDRLVYSYDSDNEDEAYTISSYYYDDAERVYYDAQTGAYRQGCVVYVSLGRPEVLSKLEVGKEYYITVDKDLLLFEKEDTYAEITKEDQCKFTISLKEDSAASISESEDAIGWKWVEEGGERKLTYTDKDGKIIDGIAELQYEDDENIVFAGKWLFDKDGYVVTGEHDGVYYFESQQGPYPYGMAVPSALLNELWKEKGVRPSSVLEGYDEYIETFSDDLNSWIKPSKWADNLVDEVFLRQLQYYDLQSRYCPYHYFPDLPDSIRNNILYDTKTNKKLIKYYLEEMFGENDDKGSNWYGDKTYRAYKFLFNTSTKVYESLISAKREEYKSNPSGNWSESFKNVMEKMDQAESQGKGSAFLAKFAKQLSDTMEALAKIYDGKSSVMADYSERIAFLDQLIETGERYNTTGRQAAIVTAASELKSNYESKFTNAIYNAYLSMIEQIDGWNALFTKTSDSAAEKSDALFIPDIDFDDNLVEDTKSVVKQLLKKGIPYFSFFSSYVKFYEFIQDAQGSATATEKFMECEALSGYSLDLLKQTETALSDNPNSSLNLVQFEIAFGFCKFLKLKQYKTMREFYETIGKEQEKVDFLTLEIDKLDKMTDTNYDSYRSVGNGGFGRWDDAERKYYYYNDQYYSNTWRWVNGYKYYFDSDGHPLTGKVNFSEITGSSKADGTGDVYYYFSTGSGDVAANSKHYGAMIKGLVEISGKEMYFSDPDGSGELRKGLVVDGYMVYEFDEHADFLSKASRADYNFGKKAYEGYTGKLNCPVDVRVYDGKHILLASIINNEAKQENGKVTAFVDANEQKTIQIPLGMEDVTVEVTATGNGTMDYSFLEMDSDGLVERADYRDVEIKTGDKLYGSIDEDNSIKFVLQKDEETLVPTEIQGAESYGKIEVRSEGNGTVSNETYVLRGDFAKLSATAGTGAKFSGWYDENNTLLSSETEYRMRVLGAVSLLAKFEPATDASTGNRTAARSASRSGSSSGGGGGSSGGSSSSGSGASGIHSASSTSSASSASAAGSTAQSGITAATAMPDTPGTWWQDTLGNWFYRKADGSNWTGWIVYGRQWYYLDENGKMQIGWKEINGKWFYFHTLSDGYKGRMWFSQTTPDGYRVGIDGSWQH